MINDINENNFIVRIKIEARQTSNTSNLQNNYVMFSCVCM